MEYDNVTVVTVIIGGAISTEEATGADWQDPDPGYIGLGPTVTMAVITIVTMLGSIFGNGVVCVIVHQKLAMRSAINLLLANMALANILLCASCAPFVLTTLLAGGSWVFGAVVCRAIAFCHRLLVAEAVLMLFLISIDRYLIIVEKRDRLTPFRAKWLISASWCVSAVLSIPPVVGWGSYRHYAGWVQCLFADDGDTVAVDVAYLLASMTLIFYGPMAVLTYTYLRIADTVRKRGSRVHVQNCLDGNVTRLGMSVVAHPHIVGVDMSFKMRAFKTILMLFVVYVVCWLPYSVAIVYWNLTRTLTNQYLTGNVLLCLGYLNTTINPCIYCWRIDKFRDACHELFPGACRVFPLLPGRTKRRINPSVMYKIKQRSSSI